MKDILQEIQEKVDQSSLYELNGRVVEVTQSLVKAEVHRVKIGEICLLRNAGSLDTTPAEVVGFVKNLVLLAPIGDVEGISITTEVIPTGAPLSVDVGDDLLGCILDGLGNVIDFSAAQKPLLSERYALTGSPPDPLSRDLIEEPISTGIRAIDGMLTIGEGQRVGVFSGAGVGKSTLLSMLVQRSNVDVIVVALIGERGKEVREFIDSALDEESRKKSVLVIATSDKTSIERIKAALTATTIAEYFRSQGKKVLLVMDSLTRYARALREVGIAMGESPVSRGYPPSVLTELPKLVERAGQSDKGSITAVYTVLVEGDDLSDPIADELMSLLDGHIVLSRELANASHYPAIDVLKSISRVMNSVVSQEHIQSANKIRKLLSDYKEIEFLVKVGEYQKGTNSEADEALDKYSTINNYLKQAAIEQLTFEDSVEALHDIANR